MSMLARTMKKNAIVLQKPSATIAIKADISTVQRKFYNALLFVAKTELKKKKELKDTFVISLSDLKALLKKETHENEYYIQELKELTNKTIEYNILHKDYTEYTITHLINTLKILERKSDKEEITIKFELPKDIVNSLLDPKGFFANINLVIVRGLSSKYSIILYEICKDYERVEIPLMTMEEFKKLFGIEGKKSYERIDNIKNRILDPAVRELNDNPNVDFLVSYELYKTGREYTHIKFFVKPKPQKIKVKQQVEDYKALTDNSDLRELLFLLPEQYRKRENCVSLLAGALQEKEKEYIKAQIEYVNSKNPENYVAYLREAIENDYAGFEIRKKEEEKRKQVQIRQLEKEKQEYVEEVIIREKDKIYQEFIEEVKTEEEKQEVFRKYLPEVYEKYPVLKGCNLNDPRVKLALRGIIVEDIIKENKILQERLEKIKEKAEKEAEEIYKMKLKEIESYLF